MKVNLALSLPPGPPSNRSLFCYPLAGTRREHAHTPLLLRVMHPVPTSKQQLTQGGV